MKIQPVILAGGTGYRLWPLSSSVKPKQFVKYFNDLSSFQNTIIRNKFLGKPLIISNIIYEDIVSEQLDEINTEAEIILESEKKNSFIPAVISAYFAKKLNRSIIALFPADHNIENHRSYTNAVFAAINATVEHKFTTIGIRPTHFNNNFGYIKTDQKLLKDLYLVSQFIEKPKKNFVDNELVNYFWNSGLYFFNADYFLKLARQFFFLETSKLSDIFDDYIEESKAFIIDKKLYEGLTSISIDDAISVKLNKMAMVRGRFRWNDLGSWQTICNFNKPDEDNNIIDGKIITQDVKNSYINSDAKQTIAIDIENTIVVFKNGKLLVANKNSAGKIKDILNNNKSELL